MKYFQLYSLALLLSSVLAYLWLEHYLAVAPDLSYALPIFLFSLAVSTACLSALACCCLVKQAAPPPVGYLVRLSTFHCITTSGNYNSDKVSPQIHMLRELRNSKVRFRWWMVVCW